MIKITAGWVAIGSLLGGSIMLIVGLYLNKYFHSQRLEKLRKNCASVGSAVRMTAHLTTDPDTILSRNPTHHWETDFGFLNPAFALEVLRLNGTSTAFLSASVEGQGLSLEQLQWRFLTPPTKEATNLEAQ